MTDSTIRQEFEKWYSGGPKWAKAVERNERGEYILLQAANSWNTWKVAWTASRKQALEEAAQAAATVLDMREEAKAERESREAKGTEDEISRLRHWMTVSTYNAGVRRCIAAIRAMKE